MIVKNRDVISEEITEGFHRKVLFKYEYCYAFSHNILMYYPIVK